MLEDPNTMTQETLNAALGAYNEGDKQEKNITQEMIKEAKSIAVKGIEYQPDHSNITSSHATNKEQSTPNKGGRG